MANPYVFTPGHTSVPLQPTPYLQQYYGSHNPHTPVMAPVTHLAAGNVSPVAPAMFLVPPTPHAPPMSGKLPRPTSWHGTPQAAPVQFPPKSPQAAPVVFPPVAAAPPSPHYHMPALGHGRRASFGHPVVVAAPAAPPTPAWLGGYATPQMVPVQVQGGQQWAFMPTGPAQPVPAPAPAPEPTVLVHPFLDGKAKPPGGELWFDLSAHEFAPLRRLPNGVVVPLSQEELMQPATHPPTTKMKITCEAVPQWPIELELEQLPVQGLGLDNVPQWVQDQNAAAAEVVPITVRDVLESVYRHLQQQITHVEWGRLGRSEEMAVSRAFTRRIKSAGDAGEDEMSLGVKRVDFLLDKFMFRGLVPNKGSKGFEDCRMVISAAK